MGQDEFDPLVARVPMDERGRLVLPLAMRERLGLAGGGQLILRLTGEGAIALETPDIVKARLRRRWSDARRDRLPSEELIAERRAEAAREQEEVERYRMNRARPPQ